MIVQAIVSAAILLAVSTVEAFPLRSAVASRGGDLQARWVGEEVHVTRLHGQTTRLASPNIESDEGLARRTEVSRRNWLATASTVGGLSLLWSCLPEPATAAPPNRVPLDELLYRILRVREATQQETRLIKTGKFKDVQRANVKLAVKFMIENYRLADAFVQASTYLEGGSARRVEAGQVGQGAVQSLYTILEYFDSSDVQNIKVDSMSGKEELVLKGLDAARDSIDAFIRYFPKATVDAVNARVREENELNIKEFDPALGSILNLPPTP